MKLAVTIHSDDVISECFPDLPEGADYVVHQDPQYPGMNLLSSPAGGDGFVLSLPEGRESEVRKLLAEWAAAVRYQITVAQAA